ncbi:hypothetical protein FUAX_13450 [Fulvitalea axinellae]|uniref:Lipoprotein n=1 Tax=Fulvitalea axinellae TaxID=1182444 RepID=A0AAU9CLI5_9BACT|nr:hypothetical protein FUAX_13450 [Fulvitalea axinellae]
MDKRLLTIALSLFMGFACQSRKDANENKAPEQDTVTNNENDTLKVKRRRINIGVGGISNADNSHLPTSVDSLDTFAVPDSIKFPGGHLGFAHALEVDYKGAQKYSDYIESKTDKNANAKGVRVTPDSIVFRLGNGSDAIFKNNDADDPDNYLQNDFVNYEFVKGYWPVFQGYYESKGVAMVNKKDGSVVNACNFPVRLNDSLFVAMNFDLQAGFLYNGFQFFHKDSAGKLKMIHELEFNDWGPSNCRITPEGDLLIERNRLTPDMKVTKDYLKLRLIQE